MTLGFFASAALFMAAGVALGRYVLPPRRPKPGRHSRLSRLLAQHDLEEGVRVIEQQEERGDEEAG